MNLKNDRSITDLGWHSVLLAPYSCLAPYSAVGTLQLLGLILRLDNRPFGVSHVLPLFIWASSGFPGFLPLKKNMQIGVSAMLNCP